MTWGLSASSVMGTPPSPPQEAEHGRTRVAGVWSTEYLPVKQSLAGNCYRLFSVPRGQKVAGGRVCDRADTSMTEGGRIGGRGLRYEVRSIEFLAEPCPGASPWRSLRSQGQVAQLAPWRRRSVRPVLLLGTSSRQRWTSGPSGPGRSPPLQVRSWSSGVATPSLSTSVSVKTSWSYTPPGGFAAFCGELTQPLWSFGETAPLHCQL